MVNLLKGSYGLLNIKKQLGRYFTFNWYRLIAATILLNDDILDKLLSNRYTRTIGLVY